MAQANGNGSAPEGERRTGGLNTRVALHAIRRRPLTLLGVFVLAAGVGAAVWFFLPLPKNTAVAVIHVSAQAPVVLAPTAESRVEFGSYRQSQAALIKSRWTMNAALKKPEVSSLATVAQAEPDAIAWLDRFLQVDARGNSEFLKVLLEGDNREDLPVILGAVVKAYLTEADERDNGARRKRLQKLTESNDKYKAELEGHLKRIDTIAKVLGSKDGPTLALLDKDTKEGLLSAIRERATLRDQLQAAELDLQAALGDERPGPLVGPPVEVLAKLVNAKLRQDPIYRELEAGVIRAQQALDAEIKKFLPGARTASIIQAEADLAAAKEKRDKYREDQRETLEAAIRDELTQQAQTRLAGLREAVASLKKREVRANARVEDIQKELAKASDYRVELENLKASIAQKQKLIDRLTEEAEQIKLELGAPPRVTLAEEPYIVAGLEGNRRLKYTLLAVLAVLGLGLTGLVMWEHRSRRVTHPDDVTAATGLRLIGAVPPAGAADRGKESDPHPMLVEAIDATRTLLLNGTPGAPPRVLAVTSAVSGEGKTSLSGHLAISLTRAGFRTLLIDGDLRAPSAHDVFGVPQTPGLCELLGGTAAAAEAVRATGLPGLSVLPAGEWTLATRQALAGDRWRAVVAQLKDEFDFVVIDTSPLLLVSDALLLAREADGVVVSVLMGVSQMAHVTEATARLQAVGAKLAGVIVNGARSAAHEYTYGYRSRKAPALPIAAAEAGR